MTRRIGIAAIAVAALTGFGAPNASALRDNGGGPAPGGGGTVGSSCAYCTGSNVCSYSSSVGWGDDCKSHIWGGCYVVGSCV